MTWVSAWPGATPIEHPNQCTAEAHATEIVRSGKASHAVAYELVLPDERNQP